MDCPICHEGGAKIIAGWGDRVRVECPGCGNFSLTGSAVRTLECKPITERARVANARGWLFEHQGLLLDTDDLAALEILATPNVANRAEKLLIAMAKLHPNISAQIIVYDESGNHARWRAASWSDAFEELLYLVQEYLIKTKSWLLEAISGMAFLRVQISPAGHNSLERLTHSGVELDSGFCAMWFGDEVTQLWTEAIQPAIKGAGYKAIRIDGVQHNNKIDDEILAGIRRSRFIVADFTGHRGGVYFEAGFALGLGRQVIWTIREDHLAEVHFDNRQYNFLIWKTGELGIFQERLQMRIEATLGRGPV